MRRLFLVSRGWLLLGSFAGALAACGQDVAGAIDGLGQPLENGIIDGKRSTKTDYPATGVMLFTTQRDDGSDFGSMLCSATLIAPDVAVAAGHCDLSLFIDTDAPINYYFSLARDVARFGEYDIDLPPRTTPIVAMVPHPKFSLRKVGPGLRHVNDLALLYLAKPVDDVDPAPLIRASEAKKLVEGAKVTIVGYGRRHEDERRRDAGIKYQGATHINEVGKFEMQISPGSPQPHKCHGDSGGPTYMKFGKGDRAREALVGITSHAYDDLDCHSGGVDTRVDPYLEWIETTLSDACSDGSRPGCTAPVGVARHDGSLHDVTP